MQKLNYSKHYVLYNYNDRENKNGNLEIQIDETLTIILLASKIVTQLMLSDIFQLLKNQEHADGVRTATSKICQKSRPQSEQPFLRRDLFSIFTDMQWLISTF